MGILNLGTKGRQRSPARTALAEAVNGVAGLVREVGKAKNALERAVSLRDQAQQNLDTVAGRATAAREEHAAAMLAAARSGDEVPAFSGARELKYAERDAEEAVETTQGVVDTLQAEFDEMKGRVQDTQRRLDGLARAVIADEMADAAYEACEDAIEQLNRQLFVAQAIKNCMQHSADPSYQRMRTFTENVGVLWTIPAGDRLKIDKPIVERIWADARAALLTNPDAPLPDIIAPAPDQAERGAA